MGTYFSSLRRGRWRRKSPRSFYSI
jgi:hypothetical protein